MSGSLFRELTPQWLKTRFLYGVDLTDDSGNPYPDSLYSRSLANAVSWIESELGIVVEYRENIAEKHDGEWKDSEAWWPFRLDRRPVQRVKECAITYGQLNPTPLPASWITVVSLPHGQIHLVPTQDTLNSTSLVVAGLPYVVSTMFQPRSYVPGYFKITYDAGFCFFNGNVTFADGVSQVAVNLPGGFTFNEAFYGIELSFNGTQEAQNGAEGLYVTDKTVSGFTINLDTPPSGGSASVHWFASDAPANLIQAIGLKAALTPLDVAGDLIAGAGVASKSISMDGLSMNINTTSSATNAGYGARVQQYERELKGIMTSLRKKWAMRNVSMV